MWKFIIRLIIYYGLVVILILAFPLYVYLQAREFTSVDEVIRTQNASSTTLFGIGYDDANQAYKQALLNQKKADIVIIGSSRVLEFHQMFFASTTALVNAGLILPDISSLIPIINDHPANSQPQIIIVGIDPWMFKPGSEVAVIPQQPGLIDRVSAFVTGEWRTVYTDYLFQKKFRLSELASARNTSSNIGINALINNEGFMADGSELYGRQSNLENDISNTPEAIEQTVASIENDRSSFDFGTSTSGLALADLNTFLATAKAHNIHVIGFITPYPHAVFQEVMSIPDQYQKEALQLPNDISAVFGKYNFPFFNYMDAATAGIPDNEFLDFQHTTDKGSLRILIDMAEKDTELQAQVSLPSLESLVISTPDPFINSDIILDSLRHN